MKRFKAWWLSKEYKWYRRAYKRWSDILFFIVPVLFMSGMVSIVMLEDAGVVFNVTAWMAIVFVLCSFGLGAVCTLRAVDEYERKLSEKVTNAL